MKKICCVISILLMMSFAVSVSAEKSIEVVFGDDITLTVNNETLQSPIVLTDNDYVKIEREDAVALYANGKYYPVNEKFKLTEDTDFSNATFRSLGLSLVDGAEVRVGNVNINEDGKLDINSESGLRFVATANYNDTLIEDENVEFGIKINAEESTKDLFIKAELFQNADKTVFSVALTNIIESNYNREYTATPYAKVKMFDGNEKYFYANSTTRSIYTVSVGLMKTRESLDEAVKNVLNAYINQSAIRLDYTEDNEFLPRLDGKGKYSSEPFFKVESENDGDAIHVKITPLNEDDGFLNSVDFASWWKDYIRINNNHSQAVLYISNDKLEGNTISFDFKEPDYVFNQSENVTVVASVGENKVTGFKAGAEVEYSLADSVTLLGLASSIGDITPGSVILPGYNKNGEVSAIELLATVGSPVSREAFEKGYGVHKPSDGTTEYKNVVARMFSKSGGTLTCKGANDVSVSYSVKTRNVKAYRVGIATNGESVAVSVKEGVINSYPSIFENTANYDNYVYLRCEAESGKIVECVYYCIPKKNDISGDGEYSEIFSLDGYKTVIK